MVLGMHPAIPLPPSKPYRPRVLKDPTVGTEALPRGPLWQS